MRTAVAALDRALAMIVGGVVVLAFPALVLRGA